MGRIWMLALWLSGCPTPEDTTDAPVPGDTPMLDVAAEDDAPTDAALDTPGDAPIGVDVPDAPAMPDVPASLCGNGAMDPGEVCDDRNTEGGDGCRADCLGVEVCGDGLADVGEWCTTRTTVMTPITGMLVGSPALADGDEDGDLDVYVSVDSSLVLLENRGDGTFEAQVPAGAADLGTFAALDDAPGLEMVLAFGDAVRVHPGRADGTLGAARLISRTDASTVGPADVDGDGDLDLVVGAFASATCAVLPNDGTGTFGAAVDFGCATGAAEIRQTLAGDLDGDGRDDVVFLHDLGTANVTVAHAEVGGRMTTRSVDSRFPAGGALGDLDGDGQLDLLHAVMVFPLALMWVRTEAGLPQPATAHIPTTAFGGGPQLVDADLDGDVDVYAFGFSSGTPFSFLKENDGAAAFTDLEADIGPGLTLADMNGDGAIDLVSIASGQLRVALAQP